MQPCRTKVGSLSNVSEVDAAISIERAVNNKTTNAVSSLVVQKCCCRCGP